MSRTFPAIDIWLSSTLDDDTRDRLIAILDDSDLRAVEERPDALRVFFGSAADRDRALTAARASAEVADARAVDVADEDWAARSQAAVGAVRVRRIVVAPPWDPLAAGGRDDVVVIQPSMGFGTGHHASTRLCIALLQSSPLDGRSMLDVGTGSGVLALVARALGASPVVGVDADADALTSAAENVELNGGAGQVELRHADFTLAASGIDGTFDVVAANLTGALLQRAAASLAAFLAPGGRLIVSGFQPEDEGAVRDALHACGLGIEEHLEDEGWLGIAWSLRANRAART